MAEIYFRKALDIRIAQRKPFTADDYWIIIELTRVVRNLNGTLETRLFT
ncbi:hypothetical protein KJ966_20815 [bacterium]|nr:hypothetical protein [bacterium]